jgi:hypothetical protein
MRLPDSDGEGTRLDRFVPPPHADRSPRLA